MSATNASLDSFNRQILACQDKAFVLARCLLEDEEAACDLLQNVIFKIYTGWQGKADDLGSRVLSGVIVQARQVSARGDWQPPGWEQLERCEQEVLLLVDVLGKSYRETSRVIERPEGEVACLIAKGRQRLLAHYAQSSKVSE